MEKHHKINIGLFVAYILIMTALMIWLGIGITPDRYILGLFVLALFLGRIKTFFLDWLPFILVLIAYDFLRGIAPLLNPTVHYLPQISFDKLVFGGVLPTVFLQQHFYTAGQLHWYDFLASFFYFVHFALPLGFGFILWVKRRDQFQKFAHAILYLSYAAFLTYLIYPAAPPWLANQNGFISGVTKIQDLVLASFPQRFNLPTLYNVMDPNQVAAVPSLHAAYPTMVLLFAHKYFGKKALFFLPYVISVYLALIYLGEHYLTDVLLGIIYAIVFYEISLRVSLVKTFEKIMPVAKRKLNLAINLFS